MTENETGYPSIDKPWMKYYDEAFLREPLPEMSLYEYLKQQTAGCERLTAITYFGSERTYEDLFANIERAARGFAQLGIKEGSRVLCLLPNLPETAYTLYALNHLGAIADFADPRPDSIDLLTSAKKLLAIVEDERVDHIIALDQCFPVLIAPIEDELRELGITSVLVVSAEDSLDDVARLGPARQLCALSGDQALDSYVEKQQAMRLLIEQALSASKLKVIRWANLDGDASMQPSLAPYHPGRIAVIVHTSGTSGSLPKPIPLTDDNMNCYVHCTFGANMPMEVGDRVLHILPYFAAFGVVDVVHAGLCHANNLVQIPEFAPSDVLLLTSLYSVQTVIGAPAWFTAALDDRRLANADLSALKMITYGGDAMDPNDEIRFNAFLKSHGSKVDLTKGYGLSETCGCATYATGDYNEPATIGIPLPHTEIALVDPSANELVAFDAATGVAEGEVVIHSPAVTLGTFDGREVARKIDIDGRSWLLTGDIASMGSNGILSFKARADRNFTRFDGYKYHPSQVEEEICKVDGVRYCSIAPYFDERVKGNMPSAFIVLEDEIERDGAGKVELVGRILEDAFVGNESLASRELPSRFRFLDELPLTKNGKIDFVSLRNRKNQSGDVLVEIEGSNIALGEIAFTEVE